MKLMVSGLINLECNTKINKFPIDYSPIEYAFDKININVSGVGYNVSKALHILGDEITPVSLIGNDTAGKLVFERLKELDLNTKYVFRYLKHTCTSNVIYDDIGKRKIYCDLKDIQTQYIPYEDIKTDINDYDGYVITNINFNDEILPKIKELGKPIFTDVHAISNVNDEYNKRFMSNADVLFLSNDNIKGNHEEFMLQLYKRYRNKVIVLGQGKIGAMMLDAKEQKIYAIESVYTRDVVNTVGAGDALFSAFVHYYIKGKQPLECLKNAMTFASFKIGESGGAEGFLSEKHLDLLVKEMNFKVYEVKNFEGQIF